MNSHFMVGCVNWKKPRNSVCDTWLWPHGPFLSTERLSVTFVKTGTDPTE